MRKFALCVVMTVIIIVMPFDAHAARLWSSGLELNSCTANVEVTACTWDGSGTASTTSATLRTGTYAMSASATSGYTIAAQTFSSGSGLAYVRAYINVPGYPSGNNSFLCLSNSNPNNFGCLYMNSSGQMGINYGDTPTYGSSLSSALQKNTWYRVELSIDATVDNTQVVTGRLDGTQIDQQTGNRAVLANTMTSASWGVGSWETITATIYFDDIAINDTTGSTQTSWPGVGSIVHMQPDSAGETDNATSTPTSWQNIDEVTPDDGATASWLDADNDILDVNTESASNAGIDSFDTVSLIQVGIRQNVASAILGTWNTRIKSASGGTVSSGTVTSHNDTIWATNGDPNSLPLIYTLTSYTDPTTAVAWTPTGTNSLDNMQIGVTSPDANPDIGVSTLWALVEYVDGVAASLAPTRLKFGIGRWRFNGGRIRLQSN